MVTANDYFTLIFTPFSGFALNLSSFTFDYANYSSDSTFPSTTFFVRSSVDGFAANTAAGVNASAASAGAFANSSISLTGASFQNLTSAIEFRIYISDSTTNANRGALIDNVTLNGLVVAVPEPTTAAMLASATLWIACFRRRRTSPA